MFLRKLPEPLLTDKLYPFFIDANRIVSHPQRLRKLRYLVSHLFWQGWFGNFVVLSFYTFLIISFKNFKSI